MTGPSLLGAAEVDPVTPGSSQRGLSVTGYHEITGGLEQGGSRWRCLPCAHLWPSLRHLVFLHSTEIAVGSDQGLEGLLDGVQDCAFAVCFFGGKKAAALILLEGLVGSGG